jgi:hypothetical protein
MPRAKVVAGIRVLVGMAMVMAPRKVLQVGTDDVTGSAILLIRTIGIRDIVIGMGALAAFGSGSAADARRWTSISLGSDALDVVAGAFSARHVGKRSALIATGTALPMVAADVWARRNAVASAG